MSISLNAVRLGGKEVLPLIEGGKGIAITAGASSGPWAAAGGIGTVSAVNADSYADDGSVIEQVYHGRTRRDRHEELIDYGIEGSVTQVKKAYDISGGNGLLNINVLWEMGGAQRVLHGVLERTKGLVHGVTCGAGMPYKLAEIAANYGVHYYPIVSSARAFNALWRRAYKNVSELLGAVVYEDPWRAGGHNGLSNAEDPTKPGDPYPRVLELRQLMRKLGIGEVPIVMAGGVWRLDEWKDWIDNKELGPIMFQFGTRPLLTKESPISDTWKQRLLALKPGDILLQRFSPTGFFSSALKNGFIAELVARSERQIDFKMMPEDGFEAVLELGRKTYYVMAEAKDKALKWFEDGFTNPLKTPDDSLIFVSADKAEEIRTDQKDCMGCLSQCKFSSWADNEKNTTGQLADPRSFCIQKTLQDVAHGGSVDDNLVFAGHNAFRFASDPFYSNGFIPTVKELVERIKSGE